MNIKNFLESIGDSIVVVADDEIVKTHVHTNDPGLALQEALKHGSLSKIKIDNMREEHQEKLIKDAEKLAKRTERGRNQRKKRQRDQEKKWASFPYPLVPVSMKSSKDLAWIISSKVVRP